MNNYLIHENKSINECYYSKKLNNGLDVILIPKPGYNKYSAYFTTKFGGDYYKYSDSDGNIHNLPFGLAHFLEHKMFEMKNDADVSEKFIALGIDSNAFTSNDMTAYTISGNKNFEEGINLLLDFVQEPYFTDKSVKKEQDIIIQEYKMYIDDPAEKIYLKANANTFNAHVLEEVVGNVDSIRSINKEMLYEAHKVFYHPSNMVLVVCGDFNIDDTFKLIEDNQNKKVFEKRENIKVLYDEESDEAIKKFELMNLDVPVPRINYNLKLVIKDKNIMKRAITSMKLRLLVDYLLGPNSDNYQYMLDNEMFSSFNFDIVNDNYVTYLNVQAVTNKPEELIEYVNEKIMSIKDVKMEREHFDMMKKVLLSSSILIFNDVENLVFEFTDTYIRGINFYEYIDQIKKLNIEDLDDVKYLINEKCISYIIAKDSK